MLKKISMVMPFFFLFSFVVVSGVLADEKIFAGYVSEVAVPAESLPGVWSKLEVTLIDDINNPPVITGAGEEVVFAKMSLEMAVQSLKPIGVRSTGNFQYSKKLSERQETLDVNIMIFKDVDSCRKAWSSKFQNQSVASMAEFSDAGSEGFKKKGNFLTYAFFRRANVYVSIKSFTDSTAIVELAKALDKKI